MRRDWPVVAALTAVVLVLSVVHPALLVLTPLGLLLVAARPPRPRLVVLGVLLLGLTLLGLGEGGFAFVERGWVLLLGGWFLLLSVARPAWPLLGRALGSVAGAGATAATLLAASRGGLGRVDWLFGRRFRDTAHTMAASLETRGGGGFGADVAAAIHQAGEWQARLYPALLALASVAALALAWWLYRRLAAGERALPPLRTFRFRDELVWLFVAGLALLVLPLGDAAPRVGQNVLVFMAGLYAVRGLAVLAVVVGVPGPLGVVAAAVVTLLLYPVVFGVTVVLGLTDTWLDLRRGRQAPDAS